MQDADIDSSTSKACHAKVLAYPRPLEALTHDGDDGYIGPVRQPRVGWPRVRIHGYPRGCLVLLI